MSDPLGINQYTKIGAKSLRNTLRNINKLPAYLRKQPGYVMSLAKPGTGYASFDKKWKQKWRASNLLPRIAGGRPELLLHAALDKLEN